jgi:hypothetical protein
MAERSLVDGRGVTARGGCWEEEEEERWEEVAPALRSSEGGKRCETEQGALRAWEGVKGQGRFAFCRRLHAATRRMIERNGDRKGAGLVVDADIVGDAAERTDGGVAAWTQERSQVGDCAFILHLKIKMCWSLRSLARNTVKHADDIGCLKGVADDRFYAGKCFKLCLALLLPHQSHNINSTGRKKRDDLFSDPFAPSENTDLVPFSLQVFQLSPACFSEFPIVTSGGSLH